MSPGIRLSGLDGRTPLGFLASLGVQAAFTDDAPPTLRWDVHTGTPIVGGSTLEALTSQVLASYRRLAHSPAMSGESVEDDLKFSTPASVRTYLSSAAASGGLASSFAAAQVSEGAAVVSGKNRGKSKPSALHFTGGQMKFLEIARGIASGLDGAGKKTSHEWLSRENILDTLTNPGVGLSLLRWGDTDGRAHALCAVSPSDGSERRRTKSLTSPALTALALLGMSRYPTWTNERNRSVTQGFFGRMPRMFVWPIWAQPAGWAAVGSMLAQARPDPDESTIEHYEAWGVAAVWAADVHESGRYGSFGGARPAWQAQAPASGPATA